MAVLDGSTRKGYWPKTVLFSSTAFVASSSLVNSTNANRMAEFGSPQIRQSTTSPHPVKRFASCSSVTCWSMSHTYTVLLMFSSLWAFWAAFPFLGKRTFFPRPFSLEEPLPRIPLALPSRLLPLLLFPLVRRVLGREGRL